MPIIPYQPHDHLRLGSAASFPGIDPRTWTAQGIVTQVIVEETGVLAVVALGPDDPGHLARVGTEYAGDGFGAYWPIEVDDHVTVAFPGGDIRAGLVVIARGWDAGDPPPAEVIANPSDVLIMVKTGQTLRMVVSGGGSVVIEARDGSLVKLGDEDVNPITDGAVCGTGIDPSTGLTYWELGSTSSKVLVKK